MKKHSYDLISKYRGELLGVATVMIILFHFAEDVYNATFVTNQVSLLYSKLWMRLISSGGVDIFCFLSGIGLFYSLEKKQSLYEFYKKRLQRILIPYILVGGAFWLIKDVIILHESVFSVLKDFFFVTFITEGKRDIWYVGFILFAYLIFPIIYKAIKSRYHKITVPVLLASSILLPFVLGIINIQELWKIDIALARFLPLCLGAIIAPLVMKQQKISIINFITLFLCVVGCYLLCHVNLGGLNLLYLRWSYSFLAILIAEILAIVMSLDKTYGLKKILGWFGKYSFEIYLVHVSIRTILNMIGISTAFLYTYIMVILVSLIISPFVFHINTYVSKKLSTERKL